MLLCNNIKNQHTILPLIAYTVILSVFYCLMPFVLVRTSATFFNISLLAINFYSIFLDHFLFGISFNFNFITLFIILITCLFIYNKLEKGEEEQMEEEIEVEELEDKEVEVLEKHL